MNSFVSPRSSAVDIDRLEDVVYRPIEPLDFDDIKSIHEDIFPVSYGDLFYRAVCDGEPNSGKNSKLFSSIAVSKTSGRMLGFILAQVSSVDEVDEDDNDLFQRQGPQDSLCYILTLGLIEEYRRSGLGTRLLNQCTEYCLTSVRSCGAIYLHVIDYNTEAIKFYEKNQYHLCRVMHDYYHIEQARYDAYLYVRYLNGYQMSVTGRLLNGTTELVVGLAYRVRSWFNGVAYSYLPKALLPIDVVIHQERVVPLPTITSLKAQQLRQQEERRLRQERRRQRGLDRLGHLTAHTNVNDTSSAPPSLSPSSAASDTEATLPCSSPA